jgi:glycogen(starch) synthase
VMLSWEYPPKLIGGLARAVHDLSRALARKGVRVTVITSPCEGRPEAYVEEDVAILRVGPPYDGGRLMDWVAEWNEAAGAAGARVIKEDSSRRLLLHAHDWLAAAAGIALKAQFRIPLVATIHATEYGRNQGIHTDLQRSIAGKEAELAAQAWRVLCCSRYMRGEIGEVLGTPGDKIDVAPNGVITEKFDFEFPHEQYRRRFALPEERIIFFVGRLVREKGAQTVLEAAPRVLAERPHAKFVIVGGGDTDHLRGLAKFLGVPDKVLFTGYMADEDLLKLYRVIDVALVPSTYEPFGIVALEAMAAGVPVVVSEVGGLREIVEPEVTGTWVWPGRPDSLAWGILRALNDPENARAMAERALERVKTVYSWDRIAELTIRTYHRVWKEYTAGDWGRRSPFWRS